MNVSLTPQLEKMVRDKVESGMYNNASEVVRDALRMIAATDLTAGSLLTRDALTDQRLPAPGQQLVGVGVSAVQLPATTLRPGDDA